MEIISQLPPYYAIYTGVPGDNLPASFSPVYTVTSLLRVRKIWRGIVTASSILLLGLPGWAFPAVWLKLELMLGYRRVDLLSEATHVAVCSHSGGIADEIIKLIHVGNDILFEYGYVRYVYSTQEKCFRRTAPITFERTSALSANDVLARQQYFGSSSYSAHISPSTVSVVLRILMEHILLSPLVYFQLFCILIWIVTKYVLYGVIVMTLFFITQLVSMRRSFQTWQHLREIAAVADEQEVTVFRDGRKVRVHANELVPGDHLLIVTDTTIPCDCIVFKGEVIADVSFVTGESRAVRCVSAPPGRLSNPEEIACLSSSLLLSGSQVLQTRVAGGGDCKALVVATAFHTLQGDFLLSVLLRIPTPAERRMTRWLVNAVAVLIVLASASAAYAVYISRRLNLNSTETIVRALDILTDAIPPALPVAVGIASLMATFSIPSHISCSRSGRPTHVLAGFVDTVVLDKTNTVTSRSMSLAGVLQQDCTKVISRPLLNSALEQALAACNSLGLLIEKATGNTHIVGDPLEVALLDAVRWELDPNDDSTVRRKVQSSRGRGSRGHVSPTLKPRMYNSSSLGSPPVSRQLAPSSSSSSSEDERDVEVSPVNRFLVAPPNSNPRVTNILHIAANYPFNPVTMVMSVIVHAEGSEALVAYTKGAPEAIAKLCRPQTLPFGLNMILDKLYALGYRILGVAHKPMPNATLWEDIPRKEVERDMQFLGLVLLYNDLHPNSEPAVRALKRAGITCILCTGDSGGTATTVARHVGIPPTASSKPNPTDPRRERLLTKEKQLVYSRMTPEAKAMLLDQLAREASGAVLMCGDGPNDASALCTADVGVIINAAPNALLESAAGCMACLNPEIGLSAIVDIVAHGRAALAALICVAKMVIAYAVIEGTSVVLNYSVGSNLSDLQYVFIDLVLVLPSVLLFAFVAAQPQSLGDSLPILPLPIEAVGVAFHCALSFTVQVLATSMLVSQSWYIPFDPEKLRVATWEHTDVYFKCQENTVLALVCIWQCLSVILIMETNCLTKWCKSTVAGYRALFAWFIFLLTFVAILIASTLAPISDWLVFASLRSKLQLMALPAVFVMELIGLLTAQSIVSAVWEMKVLPKLSNRFMQ